MTNQENTRNMFEIQKVEYLKIVNVVTVRIRWFHTVTVCMIVLGLLCVPISRFCQFRGAGSLDCLSHVAIRDIGLLYSCKIVSSIFIVLEKKTSLTVIFTDQRHFVSAV